MTTDHPRQQLHYIITHYGRNICDDPKRCEALLKDLCPQHKREVFLLVWALREGIAKELLKPNQLLPMETAISRLSQKLHDELGFDSGLAQWAVESWALALGIKFNSAIITHSSDKGKAEMGSPQGVTPTTPVNYAAALQQIKQKTVAALQQEAQSCAAKAVIDQFKGWQKIGLQGEKLAVDAPQWSAVIDEKTKLMWAINPSKTAEFPYPKKPITWSEALKRESYANTHGWCGCHDWRLPTIKELKTLLLPQKHMSLFIREDLYEDICDADYRVWSSSTVASDSNYAWVVYFNYGYSYDLNKNSRSHVRLVRSSQ